MKNSKPSAAGCLLHDPYPPAVRSKEITAAWTQYKDDEFARMMDFGAPDPASPFAAFGITDAQKVRVR